MRVRDLRQIGYMPEWSRGGGVLIDQSWWSGGTTPETGSTETTTTSTGQIVVPTIVTPPSIPMWLYFVAPVALIGLFLALPKKA